MSVENLDAQIETAISEPAQTTSDGLEVVSRTLSELIDADRYVRNKTALGAGTNANGGRRSAWGKLRMAQVVPPGTV